MKIRLYKDKETNLCFLTFLYVTFIGFFTYNFGLSEAAFYVTDVLLIILTFLCLPKLLNVIARKRMRAFSTIIISLIIMGFFSAVTNGFDILLWIWSLRNWGRLIVYFLLCIVILDKKRIDKIIEFVVSLFHINAAVIVFQFLFMDYPQDALNGLIGRTTSGANISIILLTIVIMLSKYFSKNCELKQLVLIMMEDAIVAVLAELKAVLVFELIIFVVYMVVNGRLRASQLVKYIFFMIVAVFVFYIAYALLVKIYPEFLSTFSIAGLISGITTEKGYGYSGYIDRLNVIPVINKYFFDDMGLQYKLFGIGTGNGEYSSFDFLCSRFYKNYGETFRYLRFTSAVLYLEVGIVGLLLYTLSYMVMFKDTVKEIKKRLNKNVINDTVYYENIGMGAFLIGIMFIIYTNLQRTDMAIIIAFFMAIPIATTKKNNNGE